MESGVATRPIDEFRPVPGASQRLRVPLRLHHEAGVHAGARPHPKRVVYAEGEDERMLRAAQVVVEEGLARPILIGRPAVIEARLERFGLSIRPGRDFELVNPEDDPRYRDYVQAYIELAGRKGITPDAARTLVRTNATVIAALMVGAGEADAMICGVEGRFLSHLRHIRDIIGYAPGVTEFSALSLVITAKGAFFLADTQVRPDPTAGRDRRDGGAGGRACAPLRPRAEDRARVAFRFRQLRHAIGAQDARGQCAAGGAASRNLRSTARCTATPRSIRMLRERVFPHSRLKGEANVLIMPNLDAANIAYQMIKMIADALAGRADPDRRGQARAYPDAVGDGARHRQHDGGRRRRGAGASRLADAGSF